MQRPRRPFLRVNRCLRGMFSMFLYVICPFFVPKKSGYISFEQSARRSFLHENPHKIYRRGESVTEGKFGNCIVLLSIGATIEGIDQIEIRNLTSISVQQR